MDTSNLAFYPIVHPTLHKLYEQMKSTMWVAQEIPYLQDKKDLDALDNDTKNFIKMNLCFFSQVDGIVINNLMDNFKREFPHVKEASWFFAYQAAIEVTHSETYSMLLDTFISDPVEKKKGLNAIKHYPCIENIAKWMWRWMDDCIPLPERVIAFVCVEGILFSSSFASIYWIKRKGILNGLCKANEFISRDEGLHTTFGIALYHVITNPELKVSVDDELDDTDVIEDGEDVIIEVEKSSSEDSDQETDVEESGSDLELEEDSEDLEPEEEPEEEELEELEEEPEELEEELDDACYSSDSESVPDSDQEFYDRLPEKTVHKIISRAVEVSECFVRDALKVELVGMNADDMMKYVKCTADYICTSLGYSKLYNVENPFDWMFIIGSTDKPNFFETTSSKYTRPVEQITYDVEEDF